MRRNQWCSSSADAAAVPFEHQLAAVGALVEVVAAASGSSARVGVIIAFKRARRADLASGRGEPAMTATGDVMADLPLLLRTHASRVSIRRFNTSYDIRQADLTLPICGYRVQRRRVQLVEALKAQIIQQRCRGGRWSSNEELIDCSGFPSSRDRAGVGMLQRQGMASAPARLGNLRRRSGGTGVSCGVRTITEVLLSCGVTLQVDVLSHQTGTGAATGFPRRWVWLRSSVFAGASALAINPWPWSAYLPPGGPSRRAVAIGRADTETTYAMGAATAYALHRLPTKSMPPGPPD